MRRMGCALIIVAALALYASPAGAEDSVGATDFGTLISNFPIPGDDGGACTGVPDSIPGIFDFTEACAAHDECHAAGEETRLACDLAFRQDMIAACQVQHPSPLDARRYACLAFAELYFNGVRSFGQFV